MPGITIIGCLNLDFPFLLTQEETTGVHDEKSRPVSERGPERFDEKGGVAPDVVHHEEEHSQRARLDGGWHDINQDGEQDAKPHFSCTHQNSS